MSKLGSFAVEHLAMYVDTLVASLRGRPVHAPLHERHEDTFGESVTSRRFSGHLFEFVALSAAAGLLINSVYFPSLFDTKPVLGLIIVIGFWLAEASAAHVAFKLVGGSGMYHDSVSACLQILAACYLVVSFVTLLIFTAFSTLTATRITLAEIDIDMRLVVFLSLSTLFMIIYLPLTLRRVHRVSAEEAAIASLLTVITTVVIALMIGGGGTHDSSRIPRHRR